MSEFSRSFIVGFFCVPGLIALLMILIIWIVSMVHP